MAVDQQCPICSSRVPFSERYPRYVCDACYVRAVDEDGRSLSFSNVSLSGGFAAIYRDTHEERHSHTCYIDNVRCRADEARFGGIVIQTDVEES
jgi:transposase-like protein